MASDKKQGKPNIDNNPRDNLKECSNAINSANILNRTISSENNLTLIIINRLQSLIVIQSLQLSDLKEGMFAHLIGSLCLN